MGSIPRYHLFVFSLVLIVVNWVAWVLHYLHYWYGNAFTWVSWILAVITLLCAFLPNELKKKNSLSISRTDVILFLIVTGMFLVTHLINISHAPWNGNGLFDDAAWDIYFANTHVFTNGPFQAAFFDSVGFISRETVFHYYISFFFLLFGHNLLVFNISLLVLGYITIIFTIFLIHRLFQNVTVTLITAVILNMFPLHFMHIFMGHRYAIAAPLMMVSLYYLYTAQEKQSFFRAIASSLFAALCVGSSVMGKQYLYALALGGVCTVAGGRRKLKFGFIWLIGFIVGLTPLIAYILSDPAAYSIRESNLLREFFAVFQSGGISGVGSYIQSLSEVFFASYSNRRQFLAGFYAIPLPYYFLIFPGCVLLWRRKRYELVFLSFIPVAAAFISGAYDFRVLLAVPAWIVAIAITLDAVLRRKSFSLNVIAIAVCIIGVVPSGAYLRRMAYDPNAQYLLPHRDVAVSRLVQDIVAGEAHPTSTMKHDEFIRTKMASVRHDTLACPFSAYAIIHLYLQRFDDKVILGFCDGGTQLLAGEKLFDINKIAIRDYIPSDKDLKLIWEVSDRSERIIDVFHKYAQYGHDEYLHDTVDGNTFSLYIVTIYNTNIPAFQKDVATLL